MWEHTHRVCFWPVGVACGISVPIRDWTHATAAGVKFWPPGHQGIPQWQYILPSCILKEITWVFYSYQQYTYFPIFFFRYYNLKKPLPTGEQNFAFTDAPASPLAVKGPTVASCEARRCSLQQQFPYLSIFHSWAGIQITFVKHCPRKATEMQRYDYPKEPKTNLMPKKRQEKKNKQVGMHKTEKLY